MNRAKSNERIVEEIFMYREVKEPLAPYWKQRVAKYLFDLKEALARGSASPAEQAQAARLIDALTNRKRGSPNRLKCPGENLAFAQTVDLLADRFRDQGHLDPLSAAFENVRQLEKDENGAAPSDQTLRDYYRKGLAARRRRTKAKK